MTVLVLEFGKTRIDIVVENIALQQIDDFLSRVNPDWRFKFAKEVVHEDGEAGDVIHVWMRDYDIAHAAPLRFSKGDSDTAGIDGYALVDEKAGQPLLKSSAPLGIERAG